MHWTQKIVNSLTKRLMLCRGMLLLPPLDYPSIPACALSIRGVSEITDDLRSQVNAGLLTWEQAAKEAQETRNLIMEMIRTRSRPLGRAMADRMKSSSKTLNELVAKIATSLLGLKQTLPAFLKCKKSGVYQHYGICG